jgi:hypothetical protein
MVSTYDRGTRRNKLMGPTPPRTLPRNLRIRRAEDAHDALWDVVGGLCAVAVAVALMMM